MPKSMGILPPAVVDALPCMYIFSSEQTQQCWYQQVKWNRNEIKENNFIQCKIITNFDISNIKSSTPLQVWPENNMKLGVNLVKLGKMQ